MPCFFRGIPDPVQVITTIDSGVTFPDSLAVLRAKYESDILAFQTIIRRARSSDEVLRIIRSPGMDKDRRMSLLKMFRRCVSTVCDTEATKKINTISSESLIAAYGHTFKPIDKLKADLLDLSDDKIGALAALIGEYDTRGQSGYVLTGTFFDWFDQRFKGLYSIRGPRGAGRDIELRTIFSDFDGSYPCDFVITPAGQDLPVCIGFARYDSTRGGAQSDDRTGGNANKVDKAKTYALRTGRFIKILFLADGPGLTHRDTWEEACLLDGTWDDRVRVTTLKLAPERVTAAWLTRDAPT